jgi:hypothetical protein
VCFSTYNEGGFLRLNPTTYCTYGSKKKNYHESACDQDTNKSHHLLYLWQQEKKPKPSIIVIMIARKK